MSMRSVDEIIERLVVLDQRRISLVKYLQHKVDGQDWHGCQDAGSDLRDIDAEEQGLRWVLGKDSDE